MMIRLDICYDGTAYHGWQRQPNTDQTVQHQLEAALSKLFDHKVSTMASGRTDAGVSALQQVLHFSLPEELDLSKYRVCTALNSMLPEDISVSAAFVAADNFHALLSADKKHYVYKIYTSKFKNALLERFHQHHYKNFDLNHINLLAQELIGFKDFKSFQSAGTVVPTTEREIFKSHWKQTDEEIYEYHVQGSGFLKQMVRNIVGTLLQLEAKKSAPSELQSILDAKDRTKAGPTVSGKALCLKEVLYPEYLSFEDISS